jgi:hypothetical protein
VSHLSDLSWEDSASLVSYDDNHADLRADSHRITMQPGPTSIKQDVVIDLRDSSKVDA